MRLHFLDFVITKLNSCKLLSKNDIARSGLEKLKNSYESALISLSFALSL